MKITVCIRQVPDVAAPMRVRDGKLEFDAGRLVLNAYDASAVEAALVLREAHGGEVRVVLLGPERAQETIRKALAMGADSATHLIVADDAELDSHATAVLLAGFLQSHEFDVLTFGKQSQDTDAGLTGSMVAARLDLPYATNAVGLSFDGDRLIVERQGDAGKEVLAIAPKCVVTCSNDMNDPRIPSLKGIMAAKRKPIDVVDVDAAAHKAAVKLEHIRYLAPPDRQPGRKLEGDPEEQVRELVDLLRDEARVL